MFAASTEFLLPRAGDWCGQYRAAYATHGIATGFTELDVLLPDGGWPVGTLTEIFVERPGIGELQLLMPAAAHLTQDARWLAMITPPYTPHAPALAACGVHLDQVLVLRPQTPDEQVRACEQLLESGNCGAVLMWLDQIEACTLRRLQQAVKHSKTLVVLYRSRRAQPYAAAALRLHVSKTDGRTVVQVLKRHGGGTPSPVKLDLHGSLTRRPFPALPLRVTNLPGLQAAH